MAFADSLPSLPEWETFVAQMKGEGEWKRLPALYRWESDQIGLNWYGQFGSDDVFTAWLDTLGGEIPLSSFGRNLALKNRQALIIKENDTPSIIGDTYYIPSVSKNKLRMVAKLFQQIEEWEFAYHSLKESIVDDYSFETYSRVSGKVGGFPEEASGKYVRLAYLAWKSGKLTLAEKNYRIAKMISGQVECNDDLVSDSDFEILDSQGILAPLDAEKGQTYTRKTSATLSYKSGMDSIRALYMEQRLHQRVMWLAEQGLVKPLSAEEKKDWEALEKRYCSPVTPPCWIMGSETDGPVGYGLTLEEEWEAGSGEEE